jgi:hypothetical protein
MDFPLAWARQHAGCGQKSFETLLPPDASGNHNRPVTSCIVA